ncbi:MAG: metallophosphoesterase [Myxococcota bacterium]
MHRRRLLVLAASAATAGGLLWWAAAPEASPAGSGPPPVFSLLAVGDTGKPRDLVAALDPGLAVAAALAHADRESPATGLVLLGDNFYPDGLREREFKDRVRSNLVQPFCHFLQLTPRGQGSLEDACHVSEADRHPVPIHALLGNHDYNERESPLLQRRRIPEYVENWQMPLDDFEIRELRGGVSLILIDSMTWLRGKRGDALTRAVRKSRGPWRIVAAHHPMVDTGKSAVPRFERRMAKALDEASVPIHLFLAGHEHNLQVIEKPGEWPRLHVIAGSGSDIREPTRGDPGRRFAVAEHGFARIDLAEAAGPLRITMQRVPVAAAGGARGETVARFAVDLDGTVSDLPPERD